MVYHLRVAPLALTQKPRALAMWIFIVVLLILAVGIQMFNALVRLRERVRASWADIDVQLKRRHDLVPNLVETVKGYATHEQSTLERVIQARNAAVAAHGPAKQGEAENLLTGALRSLFALSEAYPQLRADRSFGQLQESLVQLEEHIQQARRYYNAVVRDYNTRTQQIPTSLVAASFGFHQEDFFEIEDAERTAPGVRFGTEPGAPGTPSGPN